MRVVSLTRLEDAPDFVDQLVYATQRHGAFVYDISGLIPDGGYHFIANHQPLNGDQLEQVARRIME